MSTNSVSLNATGHFDLLSGETLLTPGNTADIEINVPPTIQGPKRKETAKGRVWVTDQRFIFVADNDAPPTSASYDGPPALNSLSIPYHLIWQTEYNLPTFSANNIVIYFYPDLSVSESGFPALGRGATLKAKVVVGEGAGHGIWKRIEGERRGTEERRQEGETLPAYSS